MTRPRRRTWIWVTGVASTALVLGGWGYLATRPAGSTPDLIWERAQENLRAGRYEEVGAALGRLSRLRAPTPLDWFLRAQLAVVRNQADEALADLAQVPDDHYMAARARLQAGQIERQHDRLRLAEEALRAAVRLDPSLVQAHRELIHIYGIQLRRPEINREFLALQKLTGLTFDEVYHWSSLLNNSWEPVDVIGDLIRFVAADPDDRWSRLALAGILRRMGLHDQADSTLAILSADDAEANAIRVQIALDRQDNDKADKLLDHGRRDDLRLARLRGAKALAAGDARAAARHFRIAYAADPDDHETLFGLWTALELLGDEKKARPIREAAGNLDRLNTLLQRGRVAAARQNPALFARFRDHLRRLAPGRRGPRLAGIGHRRQPARFRSAAGSLPAEQTVRSEANGVGSLTWAWSIGTPGAILLCSIDRAKSAGSNTGVMRPMRTAHRLRWVGLAALVSAAVAIPCVWILTDPDRGKSMSASRAARASAPSAEPSPASQSDPRAPLFSESLIDDNGYSSALRYSGPIADRGSLPQCYASAAGRAQRGMADLQSQLDQLTKDRKSPLDHDDRRVRLQMLMGVLYMYDGRFAEASSWFQTALAENPALPRDQRANLWALLGIAALRRGEIENCVACLGPASCIFPIPPEAVHQRTEGSREAIRRFTDYLTERPADLGITWLLNIAYMTLGEHPQKVPSSWLIAPPVPASRSDVGRFLNVAPVAGINSRGPNMLGGSVFDDFTGDGRPDILVLSGDWDLGGSLFVNRGDGTFEDRGRAAGLADQKMSVNLVPADFDNDGDLDVLALRGGWETPYRLSLLRNRGNGVFDDVTVAAGLDEPIASQSAAWGDYDNDGSLDFVRGRGIRAE